MLLRRRGNARRGPTSWRAWTPEDPRIDPTYSRPVEWWREVAGRPRHLTASPGMQPGGNASPEVGRALDGYELEPIIWLARHGYLTEPEVQYIRDQARGCAPRVGTDREQMSCYTVSQDRTAVRRARAVDAALAGEPDDGPDYDVGRGRHVDAEYPAA
jgi:hypothetical protein